MIEEDILKYFRNNAALVSAVGGTAQIDIGQVAPTNKMPWIGIEVSPGVRTKISEALMEQRSSLRITVNGGPQHKVLAKTIADMALRLLENYRGALYSTRDAYITCSAVNGISGFAGSVRYQFVASIRFTEAITIPQIVNI